MKDGHKKSAIIRRRERFKLRQLNLIWIARSAASFQYMISFLSSVSKQVRLSPSPSHYRSPLLTSCAIVRHIGNDRSI